MSDGTGTVVPSGDMDVSAVIIRACVSCNGKREIGVPCASCGLADPPVTVDLGVIAAYKADPVENFWWNVVGSRSADRRIRKANKTVKDLCGE